jgi:CspA family cold shock protein
MTGIIKRLNGEKGFGFITPDGGDKDVFFHSSSLVGVTFAELHEGEKVSFETEQSEKGPRATNVKRA